MMMGDDKDDDDDDDDDNITKKDRQGTCEFNEVQLSVL